ncbi:MAG: YbaB/EbfC family nucleoid-associated protein [Candidatus Tectomicrobia bacterium]|uniref:Nucleoid-associated protein HYY65_04610 n=1 Tax=Tectimicrobiota bacterium TaxID=2528274 RepID=A0A932GNN6_UNCTE|nr:YbaB/EbfC family nucleoid-associated protein [Candidatus Tectomicrobia bacterium]
MSKMLGNLMKQAQKMQEQVAQLQKELANRTIEATAGGGMVKVVANGNQQVVSVKIDPTVVDPAEIEMLEDLVVAAVNEALRKAQEMTAEEVSKLTGGLKIPGLFGA